MSLKLNKCVPWGIIHSLLLESFIFRMFNRWILLYLKRNVEMRKNGENKYQKCALKINIPICISYLWPPSVTIWSKHPSDHVVFQPGKSCHSLQCNGIFRSRTISNQSMDRFISRKRYIFEEFARMTEHFCLLEKDKITFKNILWFQLFKNNLWRFVTVILTDLLQLNP